MNNMNMDRLAGNPRIIGLRFPTIQDHQEVQKQDGKLKMYLVIFL